jgi:hypothetical protein
MKNGATVDFPLSFCKKITVKKEPFLALLKKGKEL